MGRVADARQQAAPAVMRGDAFQPGDVVALRSSPDFPGLVTGHARGKVLVTFADIDTTPRPFRPTSLLRIEKLAERLASSYNPSQHGYAKR
jgi:hypothetical protein